MGSSISKVTNMLETITDNDNPTPPAVAAIPLTPQIKILNLDPRSPSSDIARTPIEIVRTPLVRSHETSAFDVTEDLSLRPVDLDPRSPTTEFHRTPIVTEEQLKKLVLRNKNFDNVLTPDVTITPIKPKRNLNRVTKKICNLPKPKLLESSPITEKITSKRNSFVGLLETNLDYIETDLDLVIQSKRKGDHNNSCKEEITEVPEHVIENYLPSEMQLTLQEDLEIEENSQEDNVVEVIPQKEDIQEVPSNDYKTPVEVEEVPCNDCDTSIEMQPEELPVIDCATRASLVVDELDRKLTNLIYEDIQTEASPKSNNKLLQHRTPLGDRSLNLQKKSIPILKVSDKPLKNMAISKIPVFKEKKGKINVQCENTPPRMMTKRSQWGPEDSIVI